MHRLKLPASVVERIREARSARNLDPVEAKHGAVQVAAFLSGHYLTLDGRVLEVDFLDETETVKEVTDQLGIWRVLVVASRSLEAPELLDVLPARPPGRQDCEQCGGDRWMAFGRDVATGETGSIVCPSCHGLGWAQ